MNKANLIEKIQEENDFTKVQAERIVDRVFDTIVEQVKKVKQFLLLVLVSLRRRNGQGEWAETRRLVRPLKLALPPRRNFAPQRLLKMQSIAKCTG